MQVPRSADHEYAESNLNDYQYSNNPDVHKSTDAPIELLSFFPYRYPLYPVNATCF